MMKAMCRYAPLLEPYLPRGFEQRMRAGDIRLEKCIRSEDRSVDVRLGGEVHDGVEALIAQQGFDELRIANVAVDETQIGVILHGIQIGEVAGIGERIEHDQPLARVFLEPVMNEIGTDKSGATGDE